jgi:hypothetical protein
VIDLCNVIAGPACGRAFVELGATVVKIDPMRPLHSPTVMVTFAGETAVGKHSIILDTESAEGRAILHRLVASADLVLANKLDSQFASLGLDRESLAAHNPAAIGVQLSAHRGEKRGQRHDYPGYDPALQGLTGIMVRFGADGCPTFHGIASCVDIPAAISACGRRQRWRRGSAPGRTRRLGRVLAGGRGNAGPVAAATDARAGDGARPPRHGPDDGRTGLQARGRVDLRAVAIRSVV